MSNETRHSWRPDPGAYPHDHTLCIWRDLQREAIASEQAALEESGRRLVDIRDKLRREAVAALPAPEFRAPNAFRDAVQGIQSAELDAAQASHAEAFARRDAASDAFRLNFLGYDGPGRKRLLADYLWGLPGHSHHAA